jgi:hypothetical protein
MARRVLAAGRFQLLLFLSLIASLPAQATEPAPGTCADSAIPAEHQKEARELLQRVSAGPFYKELVRRRGTPTTCRISADDTNLTLIYEFRGNARLEAKSNSAIEYSEQRMELTGLTKARAMALLKANEKYSWGAKGCGMNWIHPDEEQPGKEPGSREVVYRGSSCNCQGRLVYAKNGVVALVSSSAC